MANTAFKIIRELINTPYGAYISIAGIIFAGSNYDTYHTNNITRELAEKYNPNGATCITIKNIFMCPVAQCEIYSVNKAVCREFIASETKVIIPPIIKVWTDEFYVNGENK